MLSLLRPPALLRFGLALALFALALAPTAAAQKKKPRRLPPMPAAFVGDLPSARTAALERNAVLVIVTLDDVEEGNVRFRDDVYKGTPFIEATLRCVVLVVNNGKHPEAKIEVTAEDGKRERTVCSIYHTPRCDDHRRNWDRVYQEYTEGDFMKLPQTLVLTPKAEIHARFLDEKPVGDIVAAIKAAQKKAGPSLTAAELAQVKKLSGTARTMAKNGKWTHAYRSWLGVVEITEAGTYGKEALVGRDKALAQMKAGLDKALERMSKGEVRAGYVRLVALEQELQKTPLSRLARAKLKEAEGNKAWKAAITAYKRELASDELWKKVTAFLGQGKDKQAERLARRILSKYGDTPAAERVRTSFPKLESGG